MGADLSGLAWATKADPVGMIPGSTASPSPRPLTTQLVVPQLILGALYVLGESVLVNLSEISKLSV